MKIHFSNVGFCARVKIKQAFANAERLLNIPKQCEVNLSFVDSCDIRTLNNQHRKIDKATDVLSFPNLEGLNGRQVCVDDFPNDINPASGNLMLGDIIICQSVAQAQAIELDHSTMREIVFLAIHGLLHLLGFDHVTEADEQQMTATQRKILNL